MFKHREKRTIEKENKREEFQWRVSYFIVLIMSLLEHTRINALGCKLTPFSTEWIKFSQNIFSDPLITCEQCL